MISISSSLILMISLIPNLPVDVGIERDISLSAVVLAIETAVTAATVVTPTVLNPSIFLYKDEEIPEISTMSPETIP